MYRSKVENGAQGLDWPIGLFCLACTVFAFFFFLKFGSIFKIQVLNLEVIHKTQDFQMLLKNQSTHQQWVSFSG